jgi:outer membrane lipoprotein-sorting protein
MKRLAVASLALFLLGTIGTVNAQTVDKILANYFENTGGLDNWKKVNSMKKTGKMTMQGMELSSEMITKKPNKSYMKIDFAGKTIVNAFDGESGWNINPFNGGATAQKSTEEEIKEQKEEKFESDFIDYKKKGHAIVLEGKEEVEGTECFKLKLTKKNGDIEFHYFDTENYVPIMTSTTIKDGPMEGKLVQSFFSDYQEAGDLIIPYFREDKLDGVSGMKMTIEKIEINPKVDDSIFAMPEEDTTTGGSK